MKIILKTLDKYRERYYFCIITSGKYNRPAQKRLNPSSIGIPSRATTLMTVCNALGVQIMLQTQIPGLPDFGITPVGWEPEGEAVEAWPDAE